MRPYLETLPYVGVSPTTPQKDAGHEIDPPVDSPSAMCGIFIALVKPPAPPDDPPQLLFGSTGFFGYPNAEFVENVPKPNSSCTVFPIIIPPSCFPREIEVASKGGM